MDDGTLKYLSLFSNDAQRSLLNSADLPGPLPLAQQGQEPDSTGFFVNAFDGFRQSAGGTIISRSFRSLSVGLAGGKDFDSDKFFKDHEQMFLDDGVRGRFVLDRYLAGAYDNVNKENEFAYALSFDQAEGDRQERMSRANGFGFVGGIAGSFGDPLNLALIAAIPATAGTTASLIGGSSFKTSLKAGVALSKAAPTIKGSFAINAGASVVQNSILLGLTPEENTFGDLAEQVAIDIAFDTTLTHALRGASFSISKIGKLKERLAADGNQLGEMLGPQLDAEFEYGSGRRFPQGFSCSIADRPSQSSESLPI